MTSRGRWISELMERSDVVRRTVRVRRSDRVMRRRKSDEEEEE